MKKIILATVCSVIATFLATFFTVIVNVLYKMPDDISLSLSIGLFMSLVAGVIGFFVILIWALPVHYYLYKFNKLNVMWYLLTAVIPSFGFIYIFKPFGHDSQIYLFQQALFCSFIGCVAAFVFWYIVVYKNRLTRQLTNAS